MLIEEGIDCRLQFLDAAMNTAFSWRSVNSAKKRSTWLSHELLVGVRCTCQRVRFASQSRIILVLWVA